MRLKAENISKKFMRNNGDANFFYGVKPQSLEIQEKALTVIYGRSGSGKTTLINLLAGLLTPSEGRIFADNTELTEMSDEERSLWRGMHVGIIPQGRAVLDTLNVWENLLFPGKLYPRTGETEESLKERARELLKALDISHLEHAWPKELSGGELRRVSIARALLYRPEVVIADEPTGDLDDENTRVVFRMLKEEAMRGAAVLMVTHEKEALEYADFCYRMDAGSCTREK